MDRLPPYDRSKKPPVSSVSWSAVPQNTLLPNSLGPLVRGRESEVPGSGKPRRLRFHGRPRPRPAARARDSYVETSARRRSGYDTTNGSAGINRCGGRAQWTLTGTSPALYQGPRLPMGSRTGGTR